MRVLIVMEWIAVTLIMTGIVLGLGCVAVEQIVYLATGAPAVSVVADVRGGK